MAIEFAHAPVLLEESLEWLAPDSHSLVVDGGISATGAGGPMPQSVSDLFAANAPNDLGKRIVAAK